MDITAAWQEVARFQETGITTSAHIYGQEQDNALVHEFLKKVPFATLFACLQDASDRGSNKEVQRACTMAIILISSDLLISNNMSNCHAKIQVKQACKCINRVLSSGIDGSSLFFQPDVRRRSIL